MILCDRGLYTILVRSRRMFEQETARLQKAKQTLAKRTLDLCGESFSTSPASRKRPKGLWPNDLWIQQRILSVQFRSVRFSSAWRSSCVQVLYAVQRVTSTRVVVSRRPASYPQERSCRPPRSLLRIMPILSCGLMVWSTRVKVSLCSPRTVAWWECVVKCWGIGGCVAVCLCLASQLQLLAWQQHVLATFAWLLPFQFVVAINCQFARASLVVAQNCYFARASSTRGNCVVDDC